MAQTPRRHGESVLKTADARFTAITPECLRLEYSPDGRFVDEPSLFAADRAVRCAGARASREEGSLVLETSRIRLTYTPDGRPFHPGNLRASIRTGDGTVAWRPGQPNPGNLGGTIGTLDGVMGPVDLGQGLLSRDGWYLLDDSRGHLLADGWVRSRPADAGLDWYLFGYGRDYAAGLRALTAVGGAVPLPRKYALGAWYSRYWPYTAEEFRRIVREYADHGFPLDVIVLDMDWHRDGWTGWSWNRDLLPDAEALLRWFHAEGLAVTLNVHPADGVGPHEDAYPAFMRTLDRAPASGETLPFDAGDRRYLEALFREVHAPLEAAGVDFWWLDWQQHPFTRSLPDLTNLAWLNRAYHRHTARDGKRGLSFSRWAGWGDHRHPIHFSGDAHTGWPMLAFEVPFTATAGNVGCFFWSHDIGGHTGPRNEESTVRWVQFGATSAALRSHSTRLATLDRRPWTYPAWAEGAMRDAFRLRAGIFPYLYSCVWQCHRDSLPLIRPMYLGWPDREEAYRNPQQYTVGEALLAAPVTSAGTGPDRLAFQTAWFPEGRWYQWFTGERFEGEAGEMVAAGIREFPLFARGGVPLPMQPYTPRMGTAPLAELWVRCFPGEDGRTGRTDLYEDDGVSAGYTRGERALTPLEYCREGDRVRVRVGPTEGRYPGQIEARRTTVELPCTLAPREALLDGTPLPAEYDAASLTTRIRLPERPVASGLEILVRVEEADAAGIRGRTALDRAGRLLGVPVKDLREALAAAAGDPVLCRTLAGLAGVGLRDGTVLYLPPGLADGDAFRHRLRSFRFGVPAKGTAWIPSGARAGRPLRLEAPPGAPSLDRRRILALSFRVAGREILLEESLDPGAWIGTWRAAPDEELARGRPAQADPEGLVDLKALGFTEGPAYAGSVLESETDQAALLRIRTDAGATLWVGGVKRYDVPGPRHIPEATDPVEVPLKRGENRLLLKTLPGRKAWRFAVSVSSARPLRERSADPAGRATQGSNRRRSRARRMPSPPNPARGLT